MRPQLRWLALRADVLMTDCDGATHQHNWGALAHELGLARCAAVLSQVAAIRDMAAYAAASRNLTSHHKGLNVRSQSQRRTDAEGA